MRAIGRWSEFQLKRLEIARTLLCKNLKVNFFFGVSSACAMNENQQKLFNSLAALRKNRCTVPSPPKIPVLVFEIPRLFVMKRKSFPSQLVLKFMLLCGCFFLVFGGEILMLFFSDIRRKQTRKRCSFKGNDLIKEMYIS